MGVLVSYRSCNKLPQILWPKLTQIYYLMVQKFNMSLTGQKSGYHQNRILPGGSGREPIVFPLQAGRGRLESSVYCPPAALKSATSGECSSHCILWHSPLPASSTFKWSSSLHCDHQTIQDTLIILSNDWQPKFSLSSLRHSLMNILPTAVGWIISYFPSWLLLYLEPLLLRRNVPWLVVQSMWSGANLKLWLCPSYHVTTAKGLDLSVFPCTHL